MILISRIATYEEAIKQGKTVAPLCSESNGVEYILNEQAGESFCRKRFAYIKGKETGETVYIFKDDLNGLYSVLGLTAEEASLENRTFPYRNAQEYKIPYLASYNTLFFKPVKEIAIEDILTPDALKTLAKYLGEDTTAPLYYHPFMDEEETEAHRSIDKAFYDYEEDGEIPLKCMPYPALLTKLTGVEVTSPKSYANGIQKLLGIEFTTSQRKGAEESYIYSASNALIRYAMYEFARTESYERLKEVLSSYDAVHIPSEGKKYTLYIGYEDAEGTFYPIEEAILSKYIYKRIADSLGIQTSIDDIAEFTGVPKSLLRRASEATLGELY